MEPLYDLRGVVKAYGAVRAVDGVDLRVERGEMVVVAGPSGSGKTTLLQLLGALDRPTSGTIAFEGRDLAALSDGELTRLRRDTLGFVFQQFNLIPTLTAAQNVEAAAGRRDRALELLDRVGLAARASHLPSQLSGGEQQRVAIARALANQPDVVLADEPTGNLDSATGHEVIEFFRELNQKDGVTLMIVTHERRMSTIAQRVITMRDGAIVEGDQAGDEFTGGPA